MERVWIHSQQHDLLKTFCRLTNRDMEDVLDDIIVEWAASGGNLPIEKAIGASPFLRNASAASRGPAKLLQLPIRRAGVPAGTVSAQQSQPAK